MASQNALPRFRHFASDNVSGVCPEAWAALEEANAGHARSYGGDPWTARAVEAIRRLFDRECDVFFLFTGTAANSLALASLSPPYGMVACHEASHILNDECSAPQALGGGLALRAVKGAHGKLPPEALHPFVAHAHVHSGKPAAVSLTQCTELGTLYRLDELRALREAAREHGLKVHMDGARFANALAALDATPREVVEAGGVDVLCLGGTKNGLMMGEAVVFFNREAARDFEYRRKQAGQLASKHRFLAAQWVGVLESGAWLRYARHANRMAAALEQGARRLGLAPVHPREANELFLPLTPPVAERLASRGWTLYDDPAWGGYRLVASWDTQEEDVRAFLADLKACLG